MQNHIANPKKLKSISSHYPSLCLFLIIYVVLAFPDIAHAYESGKAEKIQIPYELLAKHRREEIREIVATHSVLRVFQDVEFKNDQTIARFMMDHPLFLSAALKALKIKNYSVKRGNNGNYIFDDRRGVKAKFEVLYSAPGKRFYYGHAVHEGLFFKLLGRGTVFLEFRGARGNPPKTYVKANVYARIDNIVIELLLKILKPIIMPLIDKKIYKFIEETGKLAKEITMHPKKVYEAIKESGVADAKELAAFYKLLTDIKYANTEEKLILTEEVAARPSAASK